MKEFVKSDNSQLALAYVKEGEQFKDLDENKAFFWKVSKKTALAKKL